MLLSANEHRLQVWHRRTALQRLEKQGDDQVVHSREAVYLLALRDFAGFAHQRAGDLTPPAVCLTV